MQAPENTSGVDGSTGGETAGKAPPPRRRRCKNPREVRLELVRVAKGLWNNDIDPQKANALTNTYRVILQSLTDGEIEARLAMLEEALQRATDTARSGR